MLKKFIVDAVKEVTDHYIDPLVRRAIDAERALINLQRFDAMPGIRVSVALRARQ